jgi:hypothetical protein
VEEDYDDEDDNQDEEPYNMLPNTGKSRSFLVTIDEHHPQPTAIIKKQGKR